MEVNLKQSGVFIRSKPKRGVTAYIIISSTWEAFFGVSSFTPVIKYSFRNIDKTNEFYLFKENLYEQFLIKTARFYTSILSITKF